MLRLVINGRFLSQHVTGVQRVSIQFVKALDGLLARGDVRDLEVTLLHPAGGEIRTSLDLRRIEVQRVGRFTGHLWEQIDLPRHAGDNPLLCLGNLAPWSRLVGQEVAPTYVMVHDLSYKYFPKSYSRPFRLLYNLAIPLVLKRATHVFTVSESERNAILRTYSNVISKDRLTAAQNGGGEYVRTEGGAYPIDEARLHRGRESRENLCLYVGSLTQRKNAHGILAAANILSRRGIRFEIIGSSGPSFGTVDPPTGATDNGHISFLGQVDDPRILRDAYSRAMVFVFPSFYEASPLPPVEAMSLGCPVVAADIPSLRERCQDGAAYCDPDDVNSIVEQVQRLFDDEEQWRKAQRAGERVAAEYSWEAQVQRVLAEVAGTR